MFINMGIIINSTNNITEGLRLKLESYQILNLNFISS